jgi:transposase-like protein
MHHRFPAEMIRHGVGLYYRFCLRSRDVEELRCARGVLVLYEASRTRGQQFG